MQTLPNLHARSVGNMAIFEFNAFINVEADNYDEAIDVFQFQLKYGINKDNVYVADIRDLELSE